jgi:hypothetical protein
MALDTVGERASVIECGMRGVHRRLTAMKYGTSGTAP